MKLIGLTGGTGMGKSTAANFFQRLGLPVVDTDLIARQVVEPGQPALAAIREAFGPAMLDASGCLRREELARVVFADPVQRRRLEAMVHPHVHEVWRRAVAAWQMEGRPLGVVVIPLLFEVDGESWFNRILCVACSGATQQERLLARGWTAQVIEQRLAAQWPITRKMAAAHYVVWTEGSLAAHHQQLERILATLR